MAAFKDIAALIEDKNKRVVEGLYQAAIILYSTLCGTKRLARAPFNKIKLLHAWFQRSICPIFKNMEELRASKTAGETD